MHVGNNYTSVDVMMCDSRRQLFLTQLSTLVVVVCKETLHTEIKHHCERKRLTVILPKTELRLRLMVLSLIDL